MADYRFGDCEIHAKAVTLMRAGKPVAVEPQVFELLLFLLENRDRVVSKDDLIESVWKGRIVSDATLSSRISAARRAIGDSGATQSAIRTVARRGVQFIMPVERLSGEPAAQTGPAGVFPSTRYCTSPDGVALPYADSGAGTTLIKVANWLNHLERDWSSPVWGPLFRALSDRHRLLRYDSRGIGLSDWNIADISFETFVADLESVIAADGTDTFALLGISQGAAVAIEYAARHPDRVTHLVLWGGFSRGRRKRSREEDRSESQAFLTLMRQGWGKERSPFRDMFASLYLPDGNDEQIRWWTDLQKQATSADNAVMMREAIDDLDVSARLAELRVPTLIIHSERDLVAPLDEARYMAARIPDAHIVTLDSTNHLVMQQEDAWSRALDEVKAFLAS